MVVIYLTDVASDKITELIRSMKYVQKDMYDLFRWEEEFLIHRAEEEGIEGMREFLAGNRKLGNHIRGVKWSKKREYE